MSYNGNVVNLSQDIIADFIKTGYDPMNNFVSCLCKIMDWREVQQMAIDLLANTIYVSVQKSLKLASIYEYINNKETRKPNMFCGKFRQVNFHSGSFLLDDAIYGVDCECGMAAIMLTLDAVRDESESDLRLVAGVMQSKVNDVSVKISAPLNGWSYLEVEMSRGENTALFKVLGHLFYDNYVRPT